ncbi:G-type lectin S-receptor-like serine/threonine-protein kinase [Striga hermonthica]|uniref:non-specific serine/threonine protein kinase n=1 Tax=Striga hermonthica TaxID=68872 RepID=A0A9N7MSI7_STRHE|nr:G-type lectin S-receptor-like serine/threonine-protein kinase [Striga hermonthica]
MGFLFYFLSFLSISLPLVSAGFFTEFVYPNFTASNIRFRDGNGRFLFSSNGKFKAAMFNPGSQRTRFYLCVIHVESNMIIWSANRDSPVSESGTVALTVNGITISDENGSQRWSTAKLKSPVSALQLTDIGNLVLLDRSNLTLWESFRHPTDTIVIGQRLYPSAVLLSAVSSDDLSTGGYNLSLTLSDVVVQWQNLVYWKLSMDVQAYVDSNYDVEFLEVNQTGLYLLGRNGSAVVISVNLPPSDFRTARIDGSGQFVVSSFAGGLQAQEYVQPADKCRIPFICGKLGLCNEGVSVDNYACSCPSGFRVSSSNRGTNCIPSDASHSLSISCNLSSSHDVSNNSNSSANVSYLPLGNDVDYFANDFNSPVVFVSNLSRCEDLCSNNCACLGIFYDNSSGSCYTLENNVGSVMLKSSSNARLGFVKTIVKPQSTGFDGYNKNNNDVSFPGAFVILPSIAAIFIFALGFLLWRRFRHPRVYNNQDTTPPSHSRSYSFSSSFEGMEFSIPGLPLRYSYTELEAATMNFETKIGTGGYGTVYKATLPDKNQVAVKRLAKIGPQGRRDFCTEIAVIGNIHHVNLVKLKGFCIHRKEWLLVYEYMSGGSLDRALFGNGPVLEWRERAKIANGSARGLAYLHSGCEPKVVHCDVKPENILLDSSHSRAKISDFGLSRFLGPEESSMLATMRGTRGYLAPEWLTRSTVSEKTDVYSFGMVLLEIVSGRKNCLPRASDGIFFFPLLALEMHLEGRYLELVDRRLKGRVTGEEVGKLVRVALCCVDQEPGWRPSMVNVVGMLEGEMPVGEPRAEGLEFLRFYGRTFNQGGPAGVEVDRVVDTCREAIGGAESCRMSDVSSEQISGPRRTDIPIRSLLREAVGGRRGFELPCARDTIGRLDIRYKFGVERFLLAPNNLSGSGRAESGWKKAAVGPGSWCCREGLCC